jgi:hypothetical protein
MFPRWTRIAVRSGFWLLVCFVAQTPALHAYVDYRQRVIFLGVSAPWWDSVSVSSLVTVLEDPVSLGAT